MRIKDRNRALWLLIFVTFGCKSSIFNQSEEIQGGSEEASAVLLTANPKVVGAWEGPFTPPEDSKDVNPVHSMLLPSGRILMVGGSGNRDLKGAIGVEVTSVDKLALIDFAAIFDPVTLKWTRIPAFPESVRTTFNRAKEFGVDPFCAGHILMTNGLALFAGGTGSYSSNFQGSRLLWAFDEKTNKWNELPPLSEGRWYPTVFPLFDGKIAILSGLNGGSRRTVSDMLDIYDPGTNTVRSIDLKNTPGYPFGTGNLLEHYPRVLPLQSGKFLITGDGSGMGPVARRSTSILTIDKDLKVSFQNGPVRQAIKKLYGTALVDPNSPGGDVLLIGGMAGVGDPGVVTPRTDPSTPTVTSMERYNASTNSWSIEPNFLGNTPADSRTGHYSIILPTGQFLVVNGSNYIQNRGTYNPILYSPAGGNKYTAQKMQRAQFPRFYHNVALLLPDGRVWVNGSNRDRATVSLDGSVEQGNVTPSENSDPNVRTTDLAALPAGTRLEREFTKVEIFQPPYLFDSTGKRIPDSQRPQIESAPGFAQYGTKGLKISVNGAAPGGKVNLIKFGSATHGWDNGQKFVALSISHAGGKDVLLNFPENPSQMPPGHYHLFYVSKDGVPSKAHTIVIEPK